MKGNIPEISVIVPVYNVEPYLAECIDSILSQTFTDFELLLVDDGSPDRCGEICDGYAGKDKRIRVLHQENAGLSCARNKGLEHALGTYIAFIDSDDYVTSTYLQELYASLPADKGQRGTVVCGFDKLLPDGSLHTVHVPQQTILPADYSRVLTELVGKYVMYAWGKLYDNRLIREYGIRFVPAVSGLEDMLFMLDYLPHSDFLLISDISAYKYRVGYSMTTLSTCIKDFHSEYAAFSNYLERVYRYKKMYGTKDSSLGRVWESLTVFFHKILLAVYKKENRYSRKERIVFLRRLLSSDKSWIKEHFSPRYKADKFSKFLLVDIGAVAFDAWMCCLWAIKFKYMFGAEK